MNYLQYELAYYPFKYQETVVFPLDVGSIIALEYLIKDEDGDPYECETTQFYFLLDPAIDSVKTAARRLFELMDKESAGKPLKIMVPTEFIIRRSCGPKK